MGEVVGATPNFLQNAFQQKFHFSNTSLSKQKIVEFAMKGGYPEAIGFSEIKEQRSWYRDYISALLERDLQDIINIRRKDAMFKLLDSLAAWSSTCINISSLGRGLSIQRTTISSYINALEALYVVDRVPPWTKTDYDRVGKQEKIFITDSGLMSAILKWNPQKVLQDGELNGKLIETFVYTQLASLVDVSDGEFELYHFRDREKHEIDFIIEDEQGACLGIEVKASATVKAESFKHLKWFKNTMSKVPNFVGIVLYIGDDLTRSTVTSLGNDHFC
jgi:predicted AAA+ superfamily ATPase